jgi:hypothetical protein
VQTYMTDMQLFSNGPANDGTALLYVAANQSPRGVAGIYPELPLCGTAGVTDAQCQQDEILKYNIRLWMMVKVWEMQDRFQLNDKTHLYYDQFVQSGGTYNKLGANADAINLIEPRGWLTIKNAFNTSPGVLFSSSLITPTYIGDLFIHESWYYMQLILNPGMGQMAGNSNIDWGYFMGTDLGSDGAKSLAYTSYNATNLPSYATLAAPFNQIMPFPVAKDLIVTLKAISERDNGISPSVHDSGGDSWGWQPARLAHELLYTTPYGSPTVGTSLNSSVPADVPFQTAQNLVIALNHAWLVKNKSYPNSSYYAAYGNLGNSLSGLDVNATIATAANQENVCNYNDAVDTVDDQICPMSLGGFWPGWMVATSGGTLPSMTSWRGGVLQDSENEIFAWMEQLWPKINFRGVANAYLEPQGTATKSECQTSPANCSGAKGILPDPIQ